MRKDDGPRNDLCKKTNDTFFCLIVLLNSSKSDNAFIHEANQPEETHFKSKTG